MSETTQRRKPIIGITPLLDVERESYWMLPGYMEGVTAAGGIPVMLPLIADETELSQLARELDGFLFTGGPDVAPKLYGEKIKPVCGELCEPRDTMEAILLKQVLEENKPVLGVCRGFQFLNAALGGNLYQDLPAEHPSDLIHHMEPPYDVPSHEVAIPDGTPLAECLGKERLGVNSCHHQGIDRLADALCAMAVADDGLVEAVWMPEKRFVWAVQWHPEFSRKKCADSQKIFDAFVGAAGE